MGWFDANDYFLMETAARERVDALEADHDDTDEGRDDILPPVQRNRHERRECHGVV